MLVEDDVVCDVQSQAGANTGTFRSKERFEDAVLNPGGNPRPVIDDFDHNFAAFGVCAQDELSLTLHGTDRVVDDVGPDLVQLAPVSFNVRQIVGILARRVVCRVKEGAEVQAGDRFGVMKFGSRMDVFVPADAQVMAKVGDRVVAAVTVIASLPQSR